MGNVPVANGVCPPDFTMVQNKCYYEYTSSLVNRDTCISICNALTPPARLLCVTDASVNEGIRLIFKTSSMVWLGINDAASEGSYVWTDACPSTYTNWGPGEPNDFFGGEDYATMGTNGLWNDVSGGSGYSCMCEIYTIIAPTAAPAAAPTFQPTYTPTIKPSARPTSQPSSQPSRQPSRQPSAQPTNQPIGTPTSQPSGQPSRQPSRQPSAQPSVHPTAQPSTRPSGQPSGQPSAGPTGQPSSRPSGQPSTQPSRQPSAQPSRQPSRQPTSQPSGAPSTQPSRQPSSRPSMQPTAGPTTQPTNQPSGQPSAQPSSQPTRQPSGQPSSSPTSQPSRQPSSQPSAQPSVQPTAQPSSQPSGQPSAQPSSQPSSQPSVQPSSTPSGQPSSQPSSQPTGEPSSQPSSSPSCQPSAQPSVQPSGRPSTQPSAEPTTQPSMQPSSQPSSQPSGEPTAQPSAQPSSLPSAQPSSSPSSQPSGQPSSVPTMQPSSVPSSQPTTQPSAQPSGEPTGQPTGRPSAQPSSLPSGQPSMQPSSLPSAQPSTPPSVQPTAQPSTQPSMQPSSQPTSAPSTTGEWTSAVNGSALFSALSYINGSVWACGGNGASSAHPASCTLADAAKGELQSEYRFPWDTITSAIVSTSKSRVYVSGRTSADGAVTSAVAKCGFNVDTGELDCAVKVLPVDIADGSYNVLARKIVYIGRNANQAAVTLLDTTADTMSHFVYATSTMAMLEFSAVDSPPNFVGSFVAGTSVRSSGVTVKYIVCGWLRSDTGQMAATIGITPVSGSIVSTAGLVNAMALEATGPDSFIAGGLELSDGAGVHAYLVRANTLYKIAQFGVRYRTITRTFRRALSDFHPGSSTGKGLVLTPLALFMIVDCTNILTNRTSLTVLKLTPTTGAIVAQAHVSSASADMHCTDITAAGVLLSIACTVQRGAAPPQSLLIGVNTDLSFIQLPAGFTKHSNATFVAEDVPLKATVLSMTSPRASVTVTDSEVSTTNQAPTRRPSAAPTVRPSQELSVAPTSRPSSSPTAAPSVSPQPSSAPSTSGPTNTHKPTFTATVRPTRSPTAQPTVAPSLHPTAQPSARPTRQPSTSRPSAVPTPGPTVVETASPSFRPTMAPTERPSARTTWAPTIADDTAAASSGGRSAMSQFVIGASTAGAVCFALCGVYVLYRRHQRIKESLQKSKSGNVKLQFDPSTAVEEGLNTPVVLIGASNSAKQPGSGKVTQVSTSNRTSLTARNLSKHRASSLPSRKIQFSDTSSFAISSLHTSECSYSEYKIKKKKKIVDSVHSNVAHSVHNHFEDSDGSNYENSDSSLSSSNSGMSHTSSRGSNSSNSSYSGSNSNSG